MTQPSEQSMVDAALMRSPRFRIALLLTVISCILATPTVVLAAASAPWIGTQNAAMIGGGSYALSWMLFGVAVWLGGSGMMTHAKRWLWRSSAS